MILATIEVHKCDGCDEIATVQTDADAESFAANWYAGLEVDFCNFCKVKIKHQAAIAGDEADADAMTDSILSVANSPALEEMHAGRDACGPVYDGH